MIRRHIDDAKITLPNDIARWFDIIPTCLTEIIGATNTAQNFIERHSNLLTQQTIRAITDEQNLANVIIERDNFQTTLYNYQDMVAELTKDLTKANNDILHKNRLLEEKL